MADLGVFHADIDAGGGAEAVAIHTITALLDAGHDVTLYTTAALGDEDTAGSVSANMNALAEDYGIRDLKTKALSVVQVATPTLQGVDVLASLATPLGVTDLPLLRQAVFERVVARRYEHHERLVCTHGEFSIDGVVEYIHFPYFAERAMRTYGTRFEEQLYPPYHRVCRAVKQRDGRPATTLTNSTWTAAVISATLGREATVVYPPVDTEAFDPPPWTEREPGFVALGRIHPLKRQHMLVDIVDSLRDCGVDTHLHVVGPIGSDDYATTLQKQADSRSYVHVEGRLPREEVIRLLETHRYGLHGRRFEHFGIAIAEMIAAGMIPFVHASGGQQTVVDDARLCYTDQADAVDRTVSILESTDQQADIRDCLADHAKQFSTAKFQETIREQVESTLN